MTSYQNHFLLLFLFLVFLLLDNNIFNLLNINFNEAISLNITEEKKARITVMRTIKIPIAEPGPAYANVGKGNSKKIKKRILYFKFFFINI